MQAKGFCHERVTLVEQREVEERLLGRKLVQAVHAPEVVDEFDVVHKQWFVGLPPPATPNPLKGALPNPLRGA